MARHAAAAASKRTLLDRAIDYVFPGWGLSRQKARHSSRHYDAAASGRRTSGWRRKSSDANEANRANLARLRELARDLRRNNGWARRGISVIGNHTVGWGIIPSLQVDPPEAKDALTKEWNAWANSTLCDYDGQRNFYGLQRLAIDTIVESGEVLVRRHRGAIDGLAIPLRLQLLEPDYLDTTMDGTLSAAGNPIIQGVEYDAATWRRVAYWLYDQHPGSNRPTGNSLQSRPVPAEDIAHVYMLERPGQVRGVSWLAAVIARLNDFDNYEDASLMRQKIAACFSAFVTDPTGNSDPIGDVDDLVETLEPGLISFLPPGKTITFAQPPQDGNVEAFSRLVLRRIAAGFGITYEDLTGDYGEATFSSSRMARIEHYHNVHTWREHMLVPMFCDRVFGWAVDLSLTAAQLSARPTATWTAPPMPMIEPAVEGEAYQTLMRAGVMSGDEMVRERGLDPEQHLDAIAAWNASLDKRGIALDSDPRQTTTRGQLQGEAAAKQPTASPAAPPDAGQQAMSALAILQAATSKSISNASARGLLRAIGFKWWQLDEILPNDD